MINLPKRRKLKDNPYTLLIEDNEYFIIFKDSKNILYKNKVDEEIFMIFNDFELEDKKIMNEYSRYIEHSELFEYNYESKMINKSLSIEEVIRNFTYEKLYKSLDLLPEIQKRRIKKYYFEGKTQQQIADEEKVDIRSIQYSLSCALKKLKKFLKWDFVKTPLSEETVERKFSFSTVLSFKTDWSLTIYYLLSNTYNDTHT